MKKRKKKFNMDVNITVKDAIFYPHVVNSIINVDYVMTKTLIKNV